MVEENVCKQTKAGELMVCVYRQNGGGWESKLPRLEARFIGKMFLTWT